MSFIKALKENITNCFAGSLTYWFLYDGKIGVK